MGAALPPGVGAAKWISTEIGSAKLDVTAPLSRMPLLCAYEIVQTSEPLSYRASRNRCNAYLTNVRCCIATGKIYTVRTPGVTKRHHTFDEFSIHFSSLGERSLRIRLRS